MMAEMASPAKKARTSDYYIEVEGQKLDRKLWALCEEMNSDGTVSKGEARQLWQAAMDDNQVTDTEKVTLKHSLKKHNYTKQAKDFLGKAIETGVVETAKTYYIEINGVKYDRILLEMANTCAQDGQISEADAKKVWEAACDGKGITPTEKKTLVYSLTHHKYTEPASKFMEEKLGLTGESEAKKDVKGSYYLEVDGQKLDRKLWWLCEEYAFDGKISKGEAMQLWQAAMDDNQVTDTEKLTLQHSMKKHNYTKAAKELLEKAIETGVVAASKAYYLELNGERYDRALMEMANKFAQDGQVSEADAMTLWEAAIDGKGVTPIEKRTLKYSMDHHKYTEPAKKYMNERLL